MGKVKIKPVKAYAVLAPDHGIVRSSVKRTRIECTQTWGGDDWRGFKALGYRCIPVLITPVTRAKAK